MSKQVIEFGGESVGVVVPDAGRLKFVAVKYHVWDLDSRHFHSADEARAAVRQLMAGQDAAERASLHPAHRLSGAASKEDGSSGRYRGFYSANESVAA